MHHVQRPTCANVRIRSTLDAHRIFLAVQHGILQMVTRRLDADERLALGTGCVYAWEERGPHTEITGLGIERFTEGRRWSPSRVRDEFLFYYEKYTPPPDANQLSAATEKQPPRDWDPLVKQTYSVYVETDKGRRKWHLTAYFTQATVDRLGTIDDISGVGDLVVPDGMFKSTRVGKGRNKSDDQGGRSNESSKASTSTITRTYAPFPSPFPPSGRQPDPSQTSPSVEMYEPYPNHPYSAHNAHFSDDNHTPHYPGNSTSRHNPLPLSPVPPVRSPQHHLGPHNRPLPAPLTPNNAYGHQETRSSLTTVPIAHGEEKRQRTAITSSRGTYVGESTYPHGANPGQNALQSPVYAPPDHPPPTSPSHPSQRWYNPPANLPYMGHHSHSSSYPHLPETPSSPYAISPAYLPPTPISIPSLSTSSSTTTATSYHYPTTAAEHYNTNATFSSPSPISANAHATFTPHHTSPTYLPALLIPESSVRDEEMVILISPVGSSSGSEGRDGEIGPSRDLAPLHALKRQHPYRRDPCDDKTLRLLDPRPAVPTTP